METLRMELCAPLVYGRYPNPESIWYSYFDLGKSGSDTENHRHGEQIFCFELDAVQSAGIEPDTGTLFGKLIFAGVMNEQGAETVQLPAGVYLFSQQRGVPAKDTVIDMAVEQQKDGLWERYSLSNVLYVRFLFEDSSMVTQIFRPVVCKG